MSVTVTLKFFSEHKCFTFNQVYTYLVEYLDTWLVMKVNIILARNYSEIFASFDESVLQLHMKVLTKYVSLYN